MICKFCGAKNQPGSVFCGKCGRKLNKHYFRNRGKAVNTLQSVDDKVKQSVSPQYKQPPQKTASKPLFVSLIIVAVLAVGSLLALILLPSAQDNQRLKLGKTTAQVATTVSAAGGEISIDDNSSVINGLSIVIPETAYSQTMDYEISTTEITAHQFGEMFNPITPLITIDNGHEFADEPMTVTIPIQKEDDEFAMAFFYDRETGELEGIPFLDIQNDSITIITAHFSDFVVAKEKKGRITEEADSGFAIDSGFTPGVDDFQMGNSGSIINIGGHCAGQCIAAMYYYNNRARASYSMRLNGRYDNNEHESTPSLMWDDAYAMRLCSVIHRNYANTWLSRSWNMHQKDSDVFYAFAYAIAITNQPQYIDIRSVGGGGHAMIVYKVTGDALYIADPNFPGAPFRTIPYEITNGIGDLKSYYSGKDATQATTDSVEYIRFSYIGMYSLFDRSIVAQAWYSIEKGEDPGSALFPPDVSLMARVWTNPDTGEYSDVVLKDDMVLLEGQELTIGPTGTFLADDSLLYYRGETYLNRIDGPGKGYRFRASDLKQGNNDIGILYVRKVWVMRGGKSVQEDRFINFYRFNIKVQAEPQLSVSPEMANAFVGDIIPFSATAANMPDGAIFVWNFGDGNIISTEDSDYPYAYDTEGAYSGDVSIVSEDSPGVPLATACFSVVVSKEDMSSTAAPAPIETDKDYPDLPDEIIGTWYVDAGAVIYDSLSSSPEVIETFSYIDGNPSYTFAENSPVIDVVGRKYDYTLLPGNGWAKYIVVVKYRFNSANANLYYGYDGRIYEIYDDVSAWSYSNDKQYIYAQVFDKIE